MSHANNSACGCSSFDRVQTTNAATIWTEVNTNSIEFHPIVHGLEPSSDVNGGSRNKFYPGHNYSNRLVPSITNFQNTHY